VLPIRDACAVAHVFRCSAIAPWVCDFENDGPSRFIRTTAEVEVLAFLSWWTLPSGRPLPARPVGFRTRSLPKGWSWLPSPHCPARLSMHTATLPELIFLRRSCSTIHSLELDNPQRSPERPGPFVWRQHPAQPRHLGCSRRLTKGGRPCAPAKIGVLSGVQIHTSPDPKSTTRREPSLQVSREGA